MSVEFKNPFFILDTAISYTKAHLKILEYTQSTAGMDIESSRRLRNKIVQLRAAHRSLNSAYGYLAQRALRERQQREREG